MNTGMFLISQHSNTCPSDYSYYSGHGEFQGVDNAISYNNMAVARKFFTRVAAQAFIDTELPMWAKDTHTVIEMDRLNLLSNYPADYAKLLEWERNRKIAKVIFRINPEDSQGVGIMEFYDRIAAIWGLDPDAMCYDCTKINISRNIQDNIFAVLDAECSEPGYTGTMWVLRGPKTFDELPDNTVEIEDGFFVYRDKHLPFNMTINIGQAA